MRHLVTSFYKVSEQKQQEEQQQKQKKLFNLYVERDARVEKGGKK